MRSPRSAIGLIVAAILCFDIAAMATPEKQYNVRYRFQVTDRPDQQRFVLTLRSADKRPICIYRDNWPNGFGQVNLGAMRVTLKSSEGEIRAHDTNFGFCAGDASCYIRILPGGTLTGFIGYEQFGKPKTIAKLARRELRFRVSPIVCEKWPPPPPRLPPYARGR